MVLGFTNYSPLKQHALYLLTFLAQVRNLGKPVDLAGQYYKDGADEVCFHSSVYVCVAITG